MNKGTHKILFQFQLFNCITKSPFFDDEMCPAAVFEKLGHSVILFSDILIVLPTCEKKFGKIPNSIMDKYMILNSPCHASTKDICFPIVTDGQLNFMSHKGHFYTKIIFHL